MTTKKPWYTRLLDWVLGATPAQVKRRRDKGVWR
jgi:hypothetical protein